jgi:hypothetical protein
MVFRDGLRFEIKPGRVASCLFSLVTQFDTITKEEFHFIRANYAVLFAKAQERWKCSES